MPLNCHAVNRGVVIDPVSWDWWHNLSDRRREKQCIYSSFNRKKMLWYTIGDGGLRTHSHAWVSMCGEVHSYGTNESFILDLSFRCPMLGCDPPVKGWRHAAEDATSTVCSLYIEDWFSLQWDEGDGTLAIQDSDCAVILWAFFGGLQNASTSSSWDGFFSVWIIFFTQYDKMIYGSVLLTK